MAELETLRQQLAHITAERDAAGAALAVARGWRPVPEQLRLAQLEGKKKPGRAKARKAAG